MAVRLENQPASCAGAMQTYPHPAYRAFMQRGIALPTINLGRIKWNQDIVDVILGVALVSIAFYTSWAAHVRLDVVGGFLLVLQTLPVAVRRRDPMRILIVTGLAITIYSLLGYRESNAWTGVFVAFYTVAANEPRSRATIAALATAGGIFLSYARYAEFNAAATKPQDLSVTYLLFGVAWLIGDNLRVRRAYTRQLEERAAELEKEREDRAVRAVAEERARIARELHDVVAHYVSVMVVQSAGARRVIDKDPRSAQVALEAVEAAGRTALAEMRRMLEVLRTDDPGMGPQPSLDDLETLVGHVRDAGLPVEVRVEGSTCCLPAGMDLVAYRIVQEALTNTVKHGGKAKASVTVRYLPDTLEIEVVDDGRGAAAPLISGSAGGGHGLIGMHERVALFGGSLQAGPVLTGGYRVLARLPIEAEDSARAQTERAASLAALKDAADRQEADASRPAPRNAIRKEPPRQPEGRHSLPPLIVRVVPPRPQQGRPRGRRERGEE
jgi:signal transduction histidine kinase